MRNYILRKTKTIDKRSDKIYESIEIKDDVFLIK